jgi:tetratricopeptide (TPR) repeat protein
MIASARRIPWAAVEPERPWLYRADLEQSSAGPRILGQACLDLVLIWGLDDMQGLLAAAARGVYQDVIDSHPEFAPGALIELLNLLQEQSDLDGVHAAYQQALDTGNPEAPYALVVVGNLLNAQGDADGARDAYQRAKVRRLTHIQGRRTSTVPVACPMARSGRPTTGSLP